MANEPDHPATIEPPSVIIPEATAKRRLAIYTLVRLVGLAVLFAGVWLAQGGINLPSVVLVLAGGATLLVRPRMLARVFGDRW